MKVYGWEILYTFGLFTVANSRFTSVDVNNHLRDDIDQFSLILAKLITVVYTNCTINVNSE